MQISKISNQIGFKPSFKANLYYKYRNIPDQWFEYDKISEAGNKNTDVFVSNVNSEKKFGDYHNSINFEVRNPLLGNNKFFVENMHTTNSNITKEEGHAEQQMYKFFAGFDTLEHFEDKTLKHTLLEKVNDAASYNDKAYRYDEKQETNPEKIFDKMLEEQNPQELGFSTKRVENFKNIAKELNNELMLSGSKALLEKDKI